MAPAASWVAAGRCPAARVTPVAGSRLVTASVEVPWEVSPPAISRPPAPGSATSRDSGADSWYGAGMTCSAIPAPDGLLAPDVGTDVEGGAEREGPCVAMWKTE